VIRGLKPGRVKRVFFSPKSSRPDMGPAQPPVEWIERLGREVHHSPPVPRLRMSGAIPLLPLNVFMVWAGETYVCPSG